MTRVSFFKANGQPSGFEIKGHACLSFDTPDVLCAAISGMTMLVANTLTESFGAELDFISDEKKPSIRLEVLSCPEENRNAVAGVLNGFALQLQDLSEQYPSNLYVEVH
ncbi:MAG: ribosomal-processing cysteine protease Prp [Clostridia bacterium]|nr:ribosomal-processing cysteine protease Prp [Clostridia bacterium]